MIVKIRTGNLSAAEMSMLSRYPGVRMFVSGEYYIKPTFLSDLQEFAYMFNLFVLFEPDNNNATAWRGLDEPDYKECSVGG